MLIVSKISEINLEFINLHIMEAFNDQHNTIIDYLYIIIII